jgi:hypothetical protein
MTGSLDFGHSRRLRRLWPRRPSAVLTARGRARRAWPPATLSANEREAMVKTLRKLVADCPAAAAVSAAVPRPDRGGLGGGLRGAATLLSSHAGTSRPATSDTAKASQAPGPTAWIASQLAAGRSPSTRPDVTAPIQTASVVAVAAAVALRTPGSDDIARSASAAPACISAGHSETPARRRRERSQLVRSARLTPELAHAPMVC